MGEKKKSTHERLFSSGLRIFLIIGAISGLITISCVGNYVYILNNNWNVRFYDVELYLMPDGNTHLGMNTKNLNDFALTVNITKLTIMDSTGVVIWEHLDERSAVLSSKGIKEWLFYGPLATNVSANERLTLEIAGFVWGPSCMVDLHAERVLTVREGQ
ncbi:MAG: hypothetical protein V1934_07635 [Methanobacteriota archaeon]